MYQFWNRLKPNFLHKVKYNIFESGGTKPIILILLIYWPIPCAIVDLVICILYHQKATKQVFPTVYGISL